jgi:thiamine biosynthesis lipoprotein
MDVLKTFRIPFRAMACPCEVVLCVADEPQAHALAELAIAEVGRIEVKYSRYRPDSIVSRINAAAGGDWIACDEETWSLLEYADTLHRYSDGLFDITSGVLRRVWDFKAACVPEAKVLAQVLELVDWSRVVLDQQRIRLDQTGMEIDFGGFGKEYAADRAGAILAGQGVFHGYVNLGGDMRILGPRPDGQPWMMGIQDPRQHERLAATLPIKQGGLATSGDYERYFEIDGRRYCHVLDPRTGQPVSHWRSISVVAPLAVVAGNCTTIAMLKQAEAIDFLESAGVDYLAVDDLGGLYMRQPAKPSAQPQQPPEVLQMNGA